MLKDDISIPQDKKEARKLEKFNQLIFDLEAKYHCQISLEKKIIANGALQITAYAHGKGFRGSDKYIQHIKQSFFPQVILDNIPITQDYSTNNPPCAVCGALGTELHHWLPQHLSSEAHLWPQDYLCREHHLFWHNIITRHYGGNDAKRTTD